MNGCMSAVSGASVSLIQLICFAASVGGGTVGVSAAPHVTETAQLLLPLQLQLQLLLLALWLPPPPLTLELQPLAAELS